MHSSYTTFCHGPCTAGTLVPGYLGTSLVGTCVFEYLSTESLLTYPGRLGRYVGTGLGT